MTDDEVRLLRTFGVGMSAIERLADEALRRGRVIVEAQALHRQAVADRARLEAPLRAMIHAWEHGTWGFGPGEPVVVSEARAALGEKPS